MAGEHHLVVIGINHAVVASTGHRTLTLAGKQTIGHREMVVLAFVVRVHVVNVVHHVGHAHGESRAVVVIVRGGGHEPGSSDDGRRTRIDFLQVVVLSRGIVDSDVHLAGIVVEINARDIVWIVVIVR